jgi:hypothetical protein
MSVLLIGGIYDVHHSDGFIWHDILTKFYEDWYEHSSNIKILSQKGCDVAITDGSDLRSAPLRWAQVA